MRILQVNKFNYLKGGAAKYFLDLAYSLEKKGLKVSKFCMADPRNIPDKNEKYFVSHIDFNNFKLKNSFKYVGRVLYSREAAKKFEKLIKEFRPDIIHLHNIYHQISPSIIPVAKRHNIPVIMHLHDYKLICPNYQLYSQKEACRRCKGGKYYNCLKRKCLKGSTTKSSLAMTEAYLHNVILKSYDKVDLFIAPSQFMKDVCVEFGVPAKKIKVVYNYVDQNEYQPTNISRENYLLYFGRLSSEKGIDVLVRAMKDVKNDMQLKIVGEGPEKDKLKNLISSLGLEKIISLEGPKYGNELKEIVSKAKAIVIPSVWYENMPLSLLEAMAMGKTVIASKTGGMPEIIEHGKNGFLFEKGNEKDLAKKINGLNEEDLNAIGNMAQSRVKRMNKSSHLDKIIKIYQSILERK